MTLSQSSERTVASVYHLHALNDGIVTGDCPVLYCAALRRTQVVDECHASVCWFVVTDSCPES